jgi:hypothetical protein
MPKKLKLKLEDIKIQSFVTNLSEEEQNKIKGGTDVATCTFPCCNNTYYTTKSPPNQNCWNC